VNGPGDPFVRQQTGIRANRPFQAEVIGLPLREPLPNIRIPLRPVDADIVLQLQPLIDECYRRGRYASIDYHHPPVPALNESDQQWAGHLLQDQGKQ
jgi:hypothetical protein